MGCFVGRAAMVEPPGKPGGSDQPVKRAVLDSLLLERLGGRGGIFAQPGRKRPGILGRSWANAGGYFSPAASGRGYWEDIGRVRGVFQPGRKRLGILGSVEAGWREVSVL